ncbi:MAG: hypothetical protein L0Z50_29260 [Verrucomicrobiales bacterium]|nr:hypothetical protein [Verrucomicrobiales bacterium]
MADLLRESLHKQHRVHEDAIRVYPADCLLPWTESNVLQIFQDISKWILSLDQPGTFSLLRDTVVITDFATPDAAFHGRLNPLVAGNDSHGALGMLVLAFPEVHFVFASSVDQKAAEKPAILMQWHSLDAASSPATVVNLKREGMTPLFDCTGLRNLIRHSIRSHENTKTFAGYLPQREDTATAIDDEEQYAFFNAYVAFRFGFRAHAVVSLGMMKRLCGSIASPSVLAFEDIYLNFTDRLNASEHYSKLDDRDQQFPPLAKSVLRVIVTGSDKGARSRSILEHNEQYLQASGQRHQFLFKPFAGIFNLAKTEQVELLIRERRRDLGIRAYLWPPEFNDTDTKYNHSAPGRLLAIAEHLLARCREHVTNVETVADAVHGAVLAQEALELLGNRTPTTSLEALALQHQFEAIAECKFYGVQSEFNVESRLQDIQTNIIDIAPFGEQAESQKETFSTWNSEAVIVGKLIKIFQDENQFDEEQECSVRSRYLHRKMWFKNHPGLLWAEFMPRYVHWLLKSTTNFIKAIVYWLLGLAAVYTIAGNGAEKGIPIKCAVIAQKALDGLYYAITSFFPMQPPDPTKHDPAKLFPMWLVCFAITGGFLHLGVFISHLYTKVTRK